MTKSDETPSFEEAMTRLESIVQAMEEGELSLDDMIARFEEGSALVRACSEKLDEVEQKIEILVKKEGGYTTQPFEDSPDQNDEEK